MAVKPIPDGYHSVTPYLTVEDADKLVEFVKQVFGVADCSECMRRPDGTIQHAEIRIGNSVVMLAQAGGPWKSRPSTLYVYVPDVDDVYRRALGAGAKSLMEPANQFYGDRNAGVEDPTGTYWWLATHIEDVSSDELHKRAAKLAQQAH
jgi:uncharacterized glyoxalase superfamily protein PhnB